MSAPTSRSTTLDEGIEHIVAEPNIWLRIAAILGEDGMWRAKLLELTSGAIPPSWELHEWQYPWALFAAMTQNGEAVANWLRAGDLTLGDRHVALPQTMSALIWERRQSRAQAPYESLEWPVTETTVATVDASRGEPQGHLVSDEGAPSFVNFYTAAVCFFWLDRQPVGGSLPQGVMYRHQDTRGRLNSVRIDGQAVEVEVEGTAIGGMVMELAGEAPGHTHRFPEHHGHSCETLRFPLEDGLPPGAWVLLRSGGEWIDRRFLTAPWTRDAEAGVEIIVEPRTKLEAFLSNREGPQTEFKRQVPTEDDGKAKLMKTVCAFANGAGGSILFGVDDDHGLNGVPIQTVDRLKDQLTQTVGSWVEPRPRLGFEILPIDATDRVVLELRVEAGSGLYGCANPGEVPTPYIRHHAITVRARPSEIEEIVQSHLAPGSYPPSWPYR